MIYDFKTYSLYYENNYKRKSAFSLMIDTLEIECLLDSGEIIGAHGFLPLVNAIKTPIIIRSYKKGSIYIKNIKTQNYVENMIYDIEDKIPESKKYFDNKLIKYDKKNGIIFLGSETKVNEDIVNINRNMYCGTNESYELKCIYLFPDKFLI